MLFPLLSPAFDPTLLPSPFVLHPPTSSLPHLSYPLFPPLHLPLVLLPFSSTDCTLLLCTAKQHYSVIVLHTHSNTPPFSLFFFEQRTSKRALITVFLYTAAAYRPMGPAHSFKESSIDESVLRRPGGGERDRWRCCSFRGRTAGRPTAPDTGEHIDCQSAHRVASH